MDQGRLHITETPNSATQGLRCLLCGALRDLPGASQMFQWIPGAGFDLSGCPP